MTTGIVLTGMRPTGALHLGHYVGALKQWIQVMEEGYDCFFLVADIQALTTHADHPEFVKEAILEVVKDWIAVGLDPALPNVHFVLQSAVPELTELTVLFSMVTPNGWMAHNPTIKAELKNITGGATVGFMMYPVSQAADILFTSPDPKLDTQPILVPVGIDQVPHLRDTNRISRKFNEIYGPTLVECKALIGEIGRLVGTDGSEKMSKSLGNLIQLKDNTTDLRSRVFSMYTDPKRIRADVPGNVEGNPVFIYHDAFNPNVDEVSDLKSRYETGRVGDVEVKGKLFKALDEFLTPIRVTRSTVTDEFAVEALHTGTDVARVLAKQTLARVKAAMHLNLL